MDIVDLWEDALREYAERTGTDLATDPFTIQLKECDSVKSIMDILDEHTKAFSTFRKGDAKIKLLRTLKPIVTAVLALGPSETLGEGISVVGTSCHWQPAKAVVGAIVVLLRATKNVSLSYDSLVELLQCVSQFLGRTTIYTRMSLTIQMREILVKMLTNVISILALATKEVKQGRLRKFVRTLLGNTDVEDALTQLTRLSTTETQMVGLESLRLMSDLVASLNEHMKSSQESTGHVRGALKDIRSSMDAVGEVLNKIKDDSIARKHRSWLSPPDPSINHNVALRSYSNGTGTWFTDGDVMGEWKTTNSLLWIHGIPGSGKTILCCSQLLSGLWSSHSSGSQQPNERDLLQCLKTMLELLSDQDLYVIIDALDECPDDSLEEHSKRHGVLKLICEIIGWGSQNLHMCVSSRPEPDIRAALEALSPCAVSLHAEDGQAHEISAYVSSVIESQSAFQRWKPQDRALAIARLSEKANGMYVTLTLLSAQC
ncbi:hypothetical protein CERSUDRAFT_75873 [Gelatoporia subvermispora B]|uniref:Uncharacterized protein n=1 Tax=Ceriporiopsis subvermispora (strain B) TaxID=914234 RepID=M2R5W6_CERS8|nr:hypothetical protein CERSUDRAFT_75873 [Gelatoporia subvermispora B]